MATGGKPTKGNRTDLQPLLEKVVRMISDHVNEEGLQIYLFGSWAQGRALAVSDLDIALDAGRPLDAAILLEIMDALDQLPTLRKVDLVDLQAVDQEFRRRVMREGELIHVR